MSQDLGSAVQGHMQDEVVSKRASWKGVTGYIRHPERALFHGHCDMNRVRQGLMSQYVSQYERGCGRCRDSDKETRPRGKGKRQGKEMQAAIEKGRRMGS